MISATQCSPATPFPRPADLPTSAQDLSFSHNAQDPQVFSADTTTLQGVSGTYTGYLETDKIKLGTPLQPAADGTYVFDASDSASHTAAVSFSTVGKTVAAFSEALGAPVTWGFIKPRLEINPDEGTMFNAYYDREDASLNFFHDVDPKTQQVVKSGDSGEVAAHEAGHAILDGLRPAYLFSYSPDVFGFHESFGDLAAMCMALQDDRTVTLCAQQTGGDLKKPNCIAATGEQLGTAINNAYDQNLTGGDFIRTAINDFTWVDPEELPDQGSYDELTREPHSYSRLWTGAMYDIFAGIQERNMASGMDAATALRATGAEGIAMLANLMKEAPQTEFTYADMAQALVRADEKHAGGANAALISSVMTARGILREQTAVPTAAPDVEVRAAEGAAFETVGQTTLTSEGRKSLAEVAQPMEVRLTGPEFGMFQGAKVVTLVDRDGALAKTRETTQRTAKDVARLIAAGRIRYNDPTYVMRPQDRFDAQGRPYAGYVRWENGEMVIERVKIAA